MVIDRPPVNALPVPGWFDLADAVTAAGADPETRVVILAAEGRGFNAGVDIKEMQRPPGYEALIGANRACSAAFAAVYECEVPVIAAVHGFCLGGGIGLVGNADVIVASDDATFGLPEVDRGALGAATHLARLVPQHLMRAMVYTGRTRTAAELHASARCSRSCPRDELRAAARGLAAEIAAKTPSSSAPAKESLNGIDPIDVQAQLPLRAGLHLRANLSGVGDEARQAFVEKRHGQRREQAARDGRQAHDRDEVVAELSDGMTIGIGGWGSRRKPMSLVRAILRSPLRDLTIVCYGGPDVGLLCAAGKVRRIVSGSCRSTRSRSSRTSGRRARRRGRGDGARRGDAAVGPATPPRCGCRSCRRAPGSARTCCGSTPSCGRWLALRPDGEELVAMPALRLDAALVHMNRADAAGNAQFLGPDLYFDDLFCLAAERRFMSCERVVPALGEGRRSHCGSTAAWSTASSRRRTAPTSPCVPDYGRDEAFQRRTPRRPPTPTTGAVQGRVPGRRRGRLPEGGPPMTRLARAESAWSPAPRRFAATARSSRARSALLPSSAPAWRADLRARPPADRRRRVPRSPTAATSRAGSPTAQIFDVVAAGRRHVMMGATQIDRFGNQNIACIGDWARPKAQLLGVRGAPGNTINHPTSYWVPQHSPRGLRRARRRRLRASATTGAIGAERFHEIRRVVTNLAVLDFGHPTTRCGCARCIPGSTVDDVREGHRLRARGARRRRRRRRAPTADELRPHPTCSTRTDARTRSCRDPHRR